MGLSCSTRAGVTPMLDAPTVGRSREEDDGRYGRGRFAAGAEAPPAALPPVEIPDGLTALELLAKVKEIWEEQVLNRPPTATPKDRSVKALLATARKVCADEYLALSDEEQRTMQFQEKGADNKPYFASLNSALVDGSTALIRADFLERLAAEGRPLGHRAELPPEAFYEGPIWAEDHGDSTRGIVIVALSQMWATLDHPDPDGEQLRDVARFLRWLQEAENGHKGKLVAVMWDWASLYQDKPEGSRSYEQTAMFNAGQRSMNLWYCHPRTITLMNRKTPAGRRNGYNISGWPVS
jgi:hypothetical protein